MQNSMYSYKRFLVILPTIGALVFSQGHAFRPAYNAGQQLIEAAEKNFTVSSHIELYKVYHIELDGTLTQRRMFLMYQYDEDQVYGLWRLLEEADQTGITLHSHQTKGKQPRLYLHDPTRNLSGEILGRDKRIPFGRTNWFLEDIYDDDKEDWNYARQPVERFFNNLNAYPIIATYKDPVLSNESHYKKRIIYLNQKDERFLRSDFYDFRNVLLKTIEVDLPVNVGSESKPQYRAQRIIIRNHQNHSVTFMLLTKSKFNQPIGKKYFTPDFIQSWTQADDIKLENMLVVH